MNRTNLLKAIMAGAMCGFLLGACTPSRDVSPPQINFLAGSKLRIDVANVSVAESYRSSAVAPHIEHKFQQSPARLAQQWADERLAAIGSSGTATLTILNASVTEEQLPGKSGIEGVVGDYPVAKYVARLQARLTVVKPGNVPGSMSTFNADVNVWSESSILKNDDPIERDQKYHDLMKKIATQFDPAFTSEIQRSMAPVIRP